MILTILSIVRYLPETTVKIAIIRRMTHTADGTLIRNERIVLVFHILKGWLHSPRTRIAGGIVL